MDQEITNYLVTKNKNAKLNILYTHVTSPTKLFSVYSSEKETGFIQQKWSWWLLDYRFGYLEYLTACFGGFKEFGRS